MKKMITILLIFVVLFSLSGCGSNKTQNLSVDEIKALLAEDMGKEIANKLKPTLKDPDSFKPLGVQASTIYYVEEDGFFAGRLAFNYTATNSFGGRVQDVCYAMAWGYYDPQTGAIRYDDITTDAKAMFIATDQQWIDAVEDEIHNSN